MSAFTKIADQMWNSRAVRNVPTAATSHSITSSARPSSADGPSVPNTLAVSNRLPTLERP
jgi:hypothetical protein